MTKARDPPGRGAVGDVSKASLNIIYELKKTERVLAIIAGYAIAYPYEIPQGETNR